MYANERYSDLKEFETLLDDAQINAKRGFQTDFVVDMIDSYEQYQEKTWLSDKQNSLLREIAYGDGNP